MKRAPQPTKPEGRAAAPRQGGVGLRNALVCTIFGVVCLMTAVGCRMEQRVDIDMTTEPVRFIVNHRGWPAPFIFPNVTEFAIASDEDKLIWQVENKGSALAPAAEFAILYGAIPRGFEQTFPVNNGAPDQLVPGHAYYVAAGSKDPWTGDYVYRMVFSLPVYRPDDLGLPSIPQRRRGMPAPATPVPPPNQPREPQPSRPAPGMRPVTP